MQIKHLLNYLKVAPHLPPKSEALNVPFVRHPDLSPSNIFISDSTALPIFLQAKIPKHFQNYGDDDSENFQHPKLAEKFATMTDSDKEIEMELYRPTASPTTSTLVTRVVLTRLTSTQWGSTTLF